jgi:phosphatidylserine/phosphatidylglycerophosphate/cardiolipin synthase-like enzyme
MALEGDVAQALGDLARKRWVLAGGTPIAKPDKCGDPWPEELDPMFQEVDVAISRTRAAHADRPQVREIEALFVDQIQRAKRFIYAENQYFASRRIAQAVVERLADADCPEFVLVNPATGRGWLDEEAMSPARTQLLEMIQKADRTGRFRIYTPVTEGGEDIYVHAKITIIDDQVLRVGSANMNNRSMGLDSECDVTIDAALNANGSTTAIIPEIMYDLLAEHLAVEPSAIAARMSECGSLIQTIEAFQTEGRSLRPLDLRDTNRLERALAEKETFDPESGGEQFEPMARPGLLAGLHRASRFGASLRPRSRGRSSA